MKIKLVHSFEDVVSAENLLEAWREFLRGKKRKLDVQQFKLNLMDNILLLHYDLINHTYKHGGYQAFNVCDPKPRNIHKAAVRDRLVHHAVYRVLYPFFERIFISDSFSCRNNKGTHKALNRFRSFFYKVSKNNTRSCWVLKCDIKKFFANIDHQVLLKILHQYIDDDEIMWLLRNIVESFYSQKQGVGLPLGNLTSQLFVNIYMNEFDQFVKHRLKEKYYIRYADDFVVFDGNRQRLVEIIPKVKLFLEKLKLIAHPDKIYIKTIASGLDFLGYVDFSDHRILRTRTKRRMFKKISAINLPSYLGILKHCNSYKLRCKIRV